MCMHRERNTHHGVTWVRPGGYKDPTRVQQKRGLQPSCLEDRILGPDSLALSAQLLRKVLPQLQV